MHCASLAFLVQVYNFSTGRLIHKLVVDDEVTAMDHDHTGQLLFCGNAQVILLKKFTKHFPWLSVVMVVKYGSSW